MKIICISLKIVITSNLDSIIPSIGGLIAYVTSKPLGNGEIISINALVFIASTCTLIFTWSTVCFLDRMF